MKVIVRLLEGGETVLEGDALIFNRNIDYTQAGRDGRLDSLGFWLIDWRYAGHPGASNKSQVFIPWTSCLMVETSPDE